MKGIILRKFNVGSECAGPVRTVHTSFVSKPPKQKPLVFENDVNKPLNGFQLMRRRIFQRDNYTCKKCGAMAIDIEKWNGKGALGCGGKPGNERYLTIDHIRRKRDGGNDKDKNLQTLCTNCHRQKDNMKSKDGLSRNQRVKLHSLSSTWPSMFSGWDLLNGAQF